jgi:putative FmdB family regulatory protein
MPTYQYACTECGERLEVVQKFTDDPMTVCPACAGRLRKLFSPVGVVFKGSGFYKTDSRGTAKSGADTKSGGDPKSGGDAKPAAEKSPAKSEPASSGSASSSGESSSSTSSASPPQSTPPGGGAKVA